jgi:hypothetical protein
MEHFIKANIKKINIMDMALYVLLMEILMMVNGLRVKKMELVRGRLRKGIVTLVNGKEIEWMVLAY